MVVIPKVRGFMCTTAHPLGCAAHVMEQIRYVQNYPPIVQGPKKVLIIGSSTGYGLATRIVSAFGAKSETIGVFFERPAKGSRTASAGWYNTASFEQEAGKMGIYAKSINGDGFSQEIKEKAISLIQQDWGGGIDLVVYSLAAPRRIHPKTGALFQSVLKPIAQSYTNKTIDLLTNQVSNITIDPATDHEIQETISVMGGEDWLYWIEELTEHKLLSPGAKTIAYSYLGPPLTYPIYAHGTIGAAKTHLAETRKKLQKMLEPLGGSALISMNKALVTQASAAIPIVPLYISLLYRVMKNLNLHEGCIEQIFRLYQNGLYGDRSDIPVDTNGQIRLDDWELSKSVQQEVLTLWGKVDTSNLSQLADLSGYRHDFYKLFGFNIPGVDYEQECILDVPIPSLHI